MESDDYQECIFKCAFRFHDSTLVYAGLDGTGNEFASIFLDLLYTGPNLSGTADRERNRHEVPDSDALDRCVVFVRQHILEKRKKETCGAGRLMRWYVTFYI